MSEKNVLEIVKILEGNSKKQTIVLTDSNFTRFVQNRPRDYHAALFLTASAKKYGCSICKKAVKIYKEAARHYADQYNFLTAAPEQRVAFFLLDVDTAKDVFTSMNLETVPRTYILPPKTANGKKQSISSFELQVFSFVYRHILESNL